MVVACALQPVAPGHSLLASLISRIDTVFTGRETLRAFRDRAAGGNTRPSRLRGRGAHLGALGSEAGAAPRRHIPG